MELTRYRWTTSSLDVPFLLGAVGASALTGPALIALLQGLGRQESAARNLVTRMRDLGAIDSQSKGRVNLYRIAPSSLSRYREVEGTSGVPTWEGRFSAIFYQVPEQQRTLRDRLLHITHTAGYGSLRAGVLIAPNDRWERLRLTMPEFTGDSWIYRTVVTPTSARDARSMASKAWRLDEINALYRAALERCTVIPAALAPGWTSLRLWRDLYTDFLAAQLEDPHLPTELLPTGWLGEQFAAAQTAVNTRLGNVLLPFLREHASAGDPDDLNEYHAPPWSV